MADSTTDEIIVEDETLRAGFTQLPNALLQRTDLSPGAKLTYMALLSFAWQGDRCFPGQERLAASIGMSKRSVDRFIKELEAVHLVSHKQRGMNQTNIYTLHRFDMFGIAKMATPELPRRQDRNRQVGNLNKTQFNKSVSKQTKKRTDDHMRYVTGSAGVDLPNVERDE